jgi:hypothetical protein
MSGAVRHIKSSAKVTSMQSFLRSGAAIAMTLSSVGTAGAATLNPASLANGLLGGSNPLSVVLPSALVVTAPAPVLAPTAPQPIIVVATVPAPAVVVAPVVTAAPAEPVAEATVSLPAVPVPQAAALPSVPVIPHLTGTLPAVTLPGIGPVPGIPVVPDVPVSADLILPPGLPDLPLVPALPTGYASLLPLVPSLPLLSGTGSMAPEPVPLPAGFVMLASALGALGFRARRRRA